MNEFSVGDKLRVEDKEYAITGKIRYKNTADQKEWMEYQMIQINQGGVFWLSCDDEFSEYSISTTGEGGNKNVGPYHQVDTGTEVVVGAWGNVDVDPGERAEFIEYEDSTQEYIMSYETWSDGMEISYGHYIEPEQILFLGHSELPKKSGRSSAGMLSVIIAACMIFSVFGSTILGGIAGIFDSFGSKTAIRKYLSKSSTYEYTTSLTDEKEKADVYRVPYTVDVTARDIINAVDGNTVDVTQNTESGDDSIGLLTKYEYCFIYTSEEGDTLVQISSRKYAFSGRQEPYHSRRTSRRYYRRYYYSFGYPSDSSSYSKSSSEYSNYSDSTVSSDDGTYNSYSSSVRQASAARRSSQGGGTGSGK